MVLVDARRTMVDINGAFLKLLGYGRDEVIGRPIHEWCWSSRSTWSDGAGGSGVSLRPRRRRRRCPTASARSSMTVDAEAILRLHQEMAVVTREGTSCWRYLGWRALPR